MAELKEAFYGDGSQRKIALLYGARGMGKTQLAVGYLKQQRNAYSVIIWLNGKDEDTLKQSFVATAYRMHERFPSPQMKVALQEKDADQAVVMVKRWLSLKDNHQWMLVFDNIDNPKIPDNRDPHAYDLRLYVPLAHQDCILVTTRSAELLIGNVIPVGKLTSIQESIAILTHTSKRQVSEHGRRDHACAG